MPLWNPYDVTAAIATHTAIPAAHQTTRTIVISSYTGDDADNRQIATGFKCSLVLIHESSLPNAYIAIRTDEGMQFTESPSIDLNYVPVLLHATDGFEVDRLNANMTGKTYYYWAISE